MKTKAQMIASIKLEMAKVELQKAKAQLEYQLLENALLKKRIDQNVF